MTVVTDILFDETGDIACVNGDMATGDSALQHQADLLMAFEGEYKESPVTGVGLNNFLNDEDPREMLRKIRMQFAADGLRINYLSFDTAVKVNAYYP